MAGQSHGNGDDGDNDQTHVAEAGHHALFTSTGVAISLL